MAISDQPPSKSQPPKAESSRRAQSQKAQSQKAQSRKAQSRKAQTGSPQTPRRRSAAAVSSRETGAASNGSDRKAGVDHSKHWTFLTNHAHVLILLHGDPELVLREVAARVGITERAVQRIVQDLEEEGFLRRHKVGRRNQYEVLARHSLRHPIESHRKIGDLLKLMEKPH